MTGLPTFAELFFRAEERHAPIGVAAAGGADPTVLAALSEAADLGWVHPIVTGNAEAIHKVAREQNIDLSRFEIIDSEAPAMAAVKSVHEGNAQLLMKGQIATPELMKAILNKEEGLRTDRAIAQVVLMEIPRDERQFLLTDTGVMIQPTLNQKQDLIDHLVSIAQKLGCHQPRIALMSATEKVNEAIPDTMETAELLKLRSGSRDYFLGGPLSFDLAYASEAGERKKLDDDVIGQADAMLFPNLLSANLTVKAIMYTADCQFGGVLAGVQVPVVFMSRADSTQTRLRSLALALSLVPNAI